MPGRKRLSRIHVDSDIQINSDILLPTTTGHYLKNVLRLKNGDQVLLFNGRSDKDFLCKIRIEGKAVLAKPDSAIDINLESSITTTLIQAIGKSEHMDFIIQKATELGITHFVFFNSDRTQNPIKASRLEKKMKHWRGITISACEQCGRNRLPTIEFVHDLKAGLERSAANNKILLDFTGHSIESLIPQLEANNSFTLLIGAEGGLTENERKQALDDDFKACVLGPRILRMETAAISILNIIQHRYGDMT